MQVSRYNECRYAGKKVVGSWDGGKKRTNGFDAATRLGVGWPKMRQKEVHPIFFRRNHGTIRIISGRHISLSQHWGEVEHPCHIIQLRLTLSLTNGGNSQRFFVEANSTPHLIFWDSYPFSLNLIYIFKGFLCLRDHKEKAPCTNTKLRREPCNCSPPS